MYEDLNSKSFLPIYFQDSLWNKFSADYITAPDSKNCKVR